MSAGSLQCHKLLWRKVHLCVVHCTDFTTSLKRIFHFGSCSMLLTKHIHFVETGIPEVFIQLVRPVRTTLIQAVRQIHVSNLVLNSRVMAVFPVRVPLLNSK
jgi:hypothetical protein